MVLAELKEPRWGLRYVCPNCNARVGLGQLVWYGDLSGNISWAGCTHCHIAYVLRQEAGE